MDDIVNPRIICAVKYMIRHWKEACQINGFNIFVGSGIIAIYSWADELSHVTPPLVFSVRDFIEKYM
jgi:hypothetical protein